MLGWSRRKKTKEVWNEKHRNVARKLFLEGCWVQKRLFDIGRMKVNVKPVTRRHRKTQALPLPRMLRDHKRDPRSLQRIRTKSRNFKGRVEVPKRYRRATSKEKTMAQGSLRRSPKVGACQHKASKVTLPRTALFWVKLQSGEHVAGQWCN